MTDLGEKSGSGSESGESILKSDPPRDFERPAGVPTPTSYDQPPTDPDLAPRQVLAPITPPRPTARALQYTSRMPSHCCACAHENNCERNAATPPRGCERAPPDTHVRVHSGVGEVLGSASSFRLA